VIASTWLVSLCRQAFLDWPSSSGQTATSGKGGPLEDTCGAWSEGSTCKHTAEFLGFCFGLVLLRTHEKDVGASG
jgi:hypothetical protein